MAGSEINYRRFFDINDLAGLRIEDQRTFTAVHEKVAQLIGRGQLQGLWLDHIDGLRDPIQYCRRLQRLVRELRGRIRSARGTSDWSFAAAARKRSPVFLGVRAMGRSLT